VSAGNVHLFLIAYDIVSDHRRDRIAHTLESYSDRIQYSVFIVDAKPAKIVRLQAALQRHIDASEDHALTCDLGPLAADPRRAKSSLAAPAITGQGPLLL
jgi:CRISPR-associated protein Cas2